MPVSAVPVAPPVVLVADGDPSVRRDVRRALELAAISVAEATDGPTTWLSLRAAAPVALILGLPLPGTTGLQLLTELRRLGNLPVLVLSDEADVEARIRAFRHGADHYLVKPVTGRELLARTRAVVRRAGAPDAAPAPTVIIHAPLHIDVQAREVRVGSAPVHLTRRELDLLAHLARSPRRVFSRAELLRQVWSSDSDWQTEATVTEHIRRIRTKLDALDPGRTWITTMRSVGYRFDPPALGAVLRRAS